MDQHRTGGKPLPGLMLTQFWCIYPALGGDELKQVACVLEISYSSLIKPKLCDTNLKDVRYLHHLHYTENVAY